MFSSVPRCEACLAPIHAISYYFLLCAGRGRGNGYTASVVSSSEWHRRCSYSRSLGGEAPCESQDFSLRLRRARHSAGVFERPRLSLSGGPRESPITGAFRGYPSLMGHGCACQIQKLSEMGYNRNSTTLATNFTLAPEMWDWQPETCSLPQWNATEFCETLTSSRTILMVGDSTMQQTAASLYSMLVFAKCQRGVWMPSSLSFQTTWCTILTSPAGVISCGTPRYTNLRS